MLELKQRDSIEVETCHNVDKNNENLISPHLSCSFSPCIHHNLQPHTPPKNQITCPVTLTAPSLPPVGCWDGECCGCTSSTALTSDCHLKMNTPLSQEHWMTDRPSSASSPLLPLLRRWCSLTPTDRRGSGGYYFTSSTMTASLFYELLPRNTSVWWCHGNLEASLQIHWCLKWPI